MPLYWHDKKSGTMPLTDFNFVLIPGHVISKNDLETHFIGPMQLRFLYGVPWSKCRVVLGTKAFIPGPRDIVLTVRNSGDYKEHLERLIYEKIKLNNLGK